MPIPLGSLGNQTWQREDLKVLIIYKLDGFSMFFHCKQRNDCVVVSASFPGFPPHVSLWWKPLETSCFSFSPKTEIIMYMYMYMCVCVRYTVIYWNIMCFDIVHRTKYIYCIYTIHAVADCRHGLKYVKWTKWSRGKLGEFPPWFCRYWCDRAHFLQWDQHEDLQPWAARTKSGGRICGKVFIKWIQTTGKLGVYQLSIKNINIRNSVEIFLSANLQPSMKYIHSCFPSIGGKPFGLGISGWFTARNLPGFSLHFTSELSYRSFLGLAFCRRKAVAVRTSPLQTFEFHGNHLWQFDEAIVGLKECPYTLQTQCITTWRCPKISKMGVPLGSSSIDPLLNIWLVVSNMFIFNFIYGMSSFPLTHIFFKMVIAPPTIYYFPLWSSINHTLIVH